jgi:hypothetical protein
MPKVIEQFVTGQNTGLAAVNLNRHTGNLDGLIANAFQIGHRLGYGQHQAQIAGNGLAPGQDFCDTLVGP